MSHHRATRLVAVAAAVSSGLLAAALAASPAFADAPGGGGGAGCTGQSCWVFMESRYITLSGDYTYGATSYAPVPVPPPPCWMSPLASGPEMYAAYEQAKAQGGVGPNGENPFADYKHWIPQIIKVRNSPGMWYSPEMNTTSIGLACGAKLPLLSWVPPGTSPPPPPIPPATLAAYAYDHMRIPSPTLVVNPAGQNYVSLPTYVWATRAGGAKLPDHLSITATAAGAGGESVTLTATAGELNVSAQDNATSYSPCPLSGSRYPVGQAPGNSGPGIAPDCGVVFRAPSTGNMITASLTWGINVTGADVHFNGIPVQGTKTVSVAEIQNLNG